MGILAAFFFLIPLLIALPLNKWVQSIVGWDQVTALLVVSGCIYALQSIILMFYMSKTIKKSEKEATVRLEEGRLIKESNRQILIRSIAISDTATFLKKTKLDSKEEEELLQNLDKLSLSAKEWNEVLFHSAVDSYHNEYRPAVQKRMQKALHDHLHRIHSPAP